MGTEILIILVVWLTIGVVIGGWISIDTFRRKVKGAKWVAGGVLLSVIGLVIYLMMRNKKKGSKQPEHHAAPEYRYSEPVAPEVQPAPTAETTVEPAPVVPQTTPEPEPVQPSPEEQMPQEAAPQTMPEEPPPEYRSWAPVVREQVEGIPRCPKCGAAASGFDEFCSECGDKIK
jgi:hypothetical protein